MSSVRNAKVPTINPGTFRIPAGSAVRLDDWPTVIAPYFHSDAHYQALLESHAARLSERQNILEACGRDAVLVIFQGMDCAGKDGSIRHVMSGINPAGCEAFTFKAPSAEELRHDFLWRTTCRLPERGRIGIFNRSYYEEVLVVRVHPNILVGQHLPAGAREKPDFWRDRLRSIVDFERHLDRNGTRIIKIFLHLSRTEQRKRLLARIATPGKNWKFSTSDFHERHYWTRYMRAYADCLTATGTRHAPWYAVPADHKENAWLIVSQIILEALDGLHLAYPRTTPKRRRELLAIGTQLARPDRAPAASGRTAAAK